MNKDKLKQVLEKRRELVTQNNLEMKEVIELAKSLDLTPPEVFFLIFYMDNTNPFEYDHMTVRDYREMIKVKRKIELAFTVSYSEEPQGVMQLWSITGLSFMDWFHLATKFMHYKELGEFNSPPFNIVPIDDIIEYTVHQNAIEKAWYKFKTPLHKRVLDKLSQ